MLTVENVDLYYGAAQALRHVSVTAETGKITCVLGRNGVGKSSLLRAIVGHQPTRAGRVTLGGKDLTPLKAYERAREGVAYVPQGREIFPLLTVRENLETGFARLPSSEDSVIGLQLENTISTEHAEIEDSVVARVTRDVRIADRVAIPAGARVYGEVVLVEPGGRLRDRSRLGVRFTSISLADGTDLAIRTEPIYREGDAPGRESTTKIGGGAIGGAIIGGILGGAKGAAIGGSVGAGAGTAAVMAGGRNHAVLSAGSPLTVRLEEPLVVTVEP
jgi:hypothetical protein